MSELMDIDIISLLIKNGIKLSRKGDKYIALCPFHNDRDTPSFTVFPQTDSWSCFSSNCINPKHAGKRNGGNGIDFLMQYHHFNYYDAKKWIRDNFESDYEPIIFARKPKKQLAKIENKIVQYYHSLLDLNNQRWWFKNRGFTDDTINEQALGFDGENHIIPIWADKPRESDCLSIKIRYHNGLIKYRRFGNFDTNIYNRYSCNGHNTIYAFAGELDALLAHQDGLGSFSLINGASSYNEFNPDEFDAKYLVVVFDKKEEISAAKITSKWCKCKGNFTAKIFHWPQFNGTDYTDYRMSHTFNEFRTINTA